MRQWNCIQQSIISSEISSFDKSSYGHNCIWLYWIRAIILHCLGSVATLGTLRGLSSVSYNSSHRPNSKATYFLCSSLSINMSLVEHFPLHPANDEPITWSMRTVIIVILSILGADLLQNSSSHPLIKKAICLLCVDESQSTYMI